MIEARVLSLPGIGSSNDLQVFFFFFFTFRLYIMIMSAYIAVNI